MAIEQRVLDRLKQLLVDGAPLSGGGQFDQIDDAAGLAAREGWIVAVQSAVHLLCPSAASPYRSKLDELATASAGFVIHRHVRSICTVVQHLLDDAHNGLLASVADQARAEVFDDFLDHAEHYRRNGKKNEAGTIVGVVFEDTLRRLCDKKGIPQKGQPMEQLIVALVKAEVLSVTKAKRARAAADLRTKATHAQWEEFDLQDVDATITFAKELVPILES